MKMRFSIIRLTIRSIRTFSGRYLALLLIVALSVGFFSGLKITKDAMVNTGNEFLEELNLYDFRLYSTLGFTKEDVNEFSKLSGVEIAEGSNSLDVMIEYAENIRPIKIMGLPNKINIPELVAGRFPLKETECLADDEKFNQEDIGTTIYISHKNNDSAMPQIKGDAFTIVGLVNSPLYLHIDRGTTNIYSGALYSYIYVPDNCFESTVYTEINVVLDKTAKIYSNEYGDLINKYEDDIDDLCTNLADKRYENLLADYNLTPEFAALFGLNKPETYVLTRNENVGYVSFENDTSIISGIANIFPIFFILIAMLVCITTMTRMVDEERTQIGILKAMGFSDVSIMAKYLIYAGSATVIGWIIGFFTCTWGLPQIFWFAYSSLYDFAPLSYLFSPKLALVTLTVSLIGILGSAIVSCRKELMSVPANLIRPRVAKSGKRILLERISPFWSKLTFLQKITLRNMFRYKQRLIMMLVGIGCCSGLVLTGFGVRDSMINISSLQFDTIQKYDIEASFKTENEKVIFEKLENIEDIDVYYPACVKVVDLLSDETMNSVNYMSFNDISGLSDFWDFQRNGEQISFPQNGEAIVNVKVAEKLGLKIGDIVEVRTAEMGTCEFIISDIFDNYIYNFIITSSDTYTDAFGQWNANTALISVNTNIEQTVQNLMDIKEITSVFQLSSTKATVDDALSCLNYIIWLIVLFSGALAFIVIFNLTNINLAERNREIATVQVLGFYPKETESYVLKENLILSVLASFIGLPLGTVFHNIVMNLIIVDTLAFNIDISLISYLLAVICTILFAIIVNLFMRRQITKIHMAESLKAVE